MPSSTRQATPGPSSILAEDMDCLISTSGARKRPGSEGVEDARHTSKKIKIDGEPLSNLSMNAKDKRKKRKKKKKRIPVVISEIEPKPKSRTPSNKPASVGKKEFVMNGPVDDTKHTARDDEKIPLKSSNKGKGKARSNSPTSQVPSPTFDSGTTVACGSGDLNDTLSDSLDHASEIARLKEQLASQDTMLQRHRIYLTQHQQALTCQICLDLMHKPFALAPCGHITCYNCLIRWFTALQNPNANGATNDNAEPLPENSDEVQLIINSVEAKRGTYLRRRKTCPVCRAAVLQRPVEMWSIKAMVVTLVNSKLVDLPVPVASQDFTTPGGANNNVDANSDPWRHIFQPTNPAKQGPLVQNQADHEHMGMYDNEDGGIYRCIDCFHEILWGVCSGCHRGYPGHERDDHDHDDDNDSDLDGINHVYQQGLGRQAARHFLQALGDGEVDDEAEDEAESVYFWDDDDEDHYPHFHHHPVYPMQEYLFLSGDEEMSGSEREGEDLGDLFHPFQPAFLGPPALGGIARIDEGSDEEHEDDYGGSFIDDNEEKEGENMDDGSEVIELDASSDEEYSPRRQPQTRIQQRRQPLFTSEDEESFIDPDDEANDIPARYSNRTVSRNPARGPVGVLLTDDSRTSGEEHDNNEEELAGEEEEEEVLSRSRARPRWVSSDEE